MKDAWYAQTSKSEGLQKGGGSFRDKKGLRNSSPAAEQTIPTSSTLKPKSSPNITPSQPLNLHKESKHPIQQCKAEAPNSSFEVGADDGSIKMPSVVEQQIQAPEPMTTSTDNVQAQQPVSPIAQL